jgi:hypothetical protein
MKKRFNYGLAALSAALLTTAAVPSFASSHREAPSVTRFPKVDNTDTYLFRSYEPGRENFVTIIANYQPLQAPYGGPSYFTMDPTAIYEIHIDNNGDAREDLTFQFRFTNALINNGQGALIPVGNQMIPFSLRATGEVLTRDDSDLAERETYTLTLVRGDRRTGTRTPVMNTTTPGTTFFKPVDNIGEKTLPRYLNYINTGGFIANMTFDGCPTAGRVFAGQRAEAFPVNLGPVFDLVNFVPIEGDSAPGAGDRRGFGNTAAGTGPGGNAPGITQSRDNDDVVGEFNITSLALELPISCIVQNANQPIVGAWATASLPQAQLMDPTPNFDTANVTGGAFVQVSRLATPLANELLVGIGEKDSFNAGEPVDDGRFLRFVTNPALPNVLNTLFLGAVNGIAANLRANGQNVPNFANLQPTNFPRNDLVAAALTGIANLNQPPNVVAGEMLRLNTSINPTRRENQNTFGVAGGDLAGFPNGRRPGDDGVDLILRVAMGRLCHDLPIGANGAPANLGLCRPADAPTGLVAYTDGAPISAMELLPTFPYLQTPMPGSPTNRQNSVGRDARAQ